MSTLWSEIARAREEKSNEIKFAPSDDLVNADSVGMFVFFLFFFTLWHASLFHSHNRI
jgi:hypothetical protein